LIAGTKCPACGSMDTEMLIEFNNRKQYECLFCNNTWIRSSGNGELRHVDPYTQWAETGEDEL
jgi:uncharacterized metal-binding protein (TIGR02443 family)